jgi:hypothetical protein
MLVLITRYTLCNQRDHNFGTYLFSRKIIIPWEIAFSVQVVAQTSKQLKHQKLQLSFEVHKISFVRARFTIVVKQFRVTIATDCRALTYAPSLLPSSRWFLVWLTFRP